MVNISCYRFLAHPQKRSTPTKYPMNKRHKQKHSTLPEKKIRSRTTWQHNQQTLMNERITKSVKRAYRLHHISSGINMSIGLSGSVGLLVSLIRCCWFSYWLVSMFCSQEIWYYHGPEYIHALLSKINNRCLNKLKCLFRLKIKTWG